MARMGKSPIISFKDSFDYIILDTPPVQAITDSQILSTKVHETILVVRAEKTKKIQLKIQLIS